GSGKLSENVGPGVLVVQSFREKLLFVLREHTLLHRKLLRFVPLQKSHNDNGDEDGSRHRRKSPTREPLLTGSPCLSGLDLSHARFLPREVGLSLAALGMLAGCLAR